MATIRKNSLKATFWVYIGFAIGALNVYLFTKQIWFEPKQYGLTNSLRELSLFVCAASTLGVTSYITKFFPYYQQYIDKNKNDMLGFAIKWALIGFVLISALLFICEPLVIRKFGTKSPLLVEYFYYSIPMAAFILSYNILESLALSYHKGILTSFLKECVLRLYTFIAILLFIGGIISFKTFIKLFVLQYGLIAFILGFLLKREGRLYLSFQTSSLTKKLKSKIKAMMMFTSAVLVVSVLRSSIDTLILASRINLEKTAVFGFATYLVSVLQAPFRSMIAITIPILSIAWKQKNYAEILRIYKRSSINLLTFSLFVFFCVLLNYTEAINFLKIDAEYILGKTVFILMGVVTIIEVGTGLNAQIIGTSTYWRFELGTNILLTIMIIPFSYYFTVKYGLIGPALGNLIAFSAFNTIRFFFLYKKFNFNPFSSKTVEVILIAFCSYLITYYLFRQLNGLLHIVSTLLLFSTLYIALIYMRDISPDLKPIINKLASDTLKARKK